jgi:hypothetical protein
MTTRRPTGDDRVQLEQIKRPGVADYSNGRSKVTPVLKDGVMVAYKSKFVPVLN